MNDFEEINSLAGMAKWQDDFIGPPKPVQAAYVMFLHSDGTSEYYTGADLISKLDACRIAIMARGSKSLMAEEMIRAMLEDFPAEYYEQPERPSWPRPPRAFVQRGQQASRQSFRKIMRSVNRNR